jgi:hypothetical protein
MNAYTVAANRLHVHCDIIRAIVSAEGRFCGYSDLDERPDLIGEHVARIAMNALTVLTERAGMSPHCAVPIHTHDLRRTGVANTLRSIVASCRRINDVFDLGVECNATLPRPDADVASDPRS